MTVCDRPLTLRDHLARVYGWDGHKSTLPPETWHVDDDGAPIVCIRDTDETCDCPKCRAESDSLRDTDRTRVW